MDMKLNKLQQIVKDRESLAGFSPWSHRVRYYLVTEQQSQILFSD